jgi:hypothetical protein
MLEGMKRKSPQRSDIRAPISIDLLKRLIKSYSMYVAPMTKLICSRPLFPFRYRLTYMLILLLINLVVFLKWDHVDSNKSLINPG